MTLMDEILLQFFMLWNGNKSIVCYLIASLGIYFPHQYKIMYSHFIRGKNTKSIVHLTLMENAHSSIVCLREKYEIYID